MCDPDSQRACRAPIRLGLLAAAVALLPLFLPRRPRIVRRMLIHADRSHVFPLINDLRNWPRWSAWHRRDEIAYWYDGPAAGVGATQHFREGRHTGVTHVKQSVPDERIAYTFMMDDRDLVESIIALNDAGPRKTEVIWTARWQGSRDYWRRYGDLLAMWCGGRKFSAGLENLRHLAETTAPIPQAEG